MIKYSLYSLGVLAFFSSSAAQSASSETERLRELLGLPGGSVIVATELDKLPVGNRPFRVFLATGTENRRRDYYERKIKQWNRHKIRHLASLEVVENLNDADLILARHELETPKRTTEPVTVWEEHFDPLTKIRSARRVKITRNYLTVLVKVYVLRRVDERTEILRETVYKEARKEGDIKPVADMLWISLLTLLSGP